MNTAQTAAAKVMLVSLKARRETARNFVMNTDMVLEAKLLTAQINALEGLVKCLREKTEPRWRGKPLSQLTEEEKADYLDHS